jgi:tubulin-folding cofactor B
MSSNVEIKNKDLLALKAFVTANDETQYNHLPRDLVLLDLTHSNLKQQHIEIRFYLSDTVHTLRSRIHQKTGTPADFQHLQIISAGICLYEIPPEYNENAKLGFFSLEHGMRVHCIDLDPHSGSAGGKYEDTSLVEKYKMSDEEYHGRKGTLKDWERQQKEKDPNFTLRKHAKEHRELVEAQRQAKLGLELPKGFEYDENGKVVRVEQDEVVDKLSMQDIPGPESVEGIKIGMRCEVQPGGRRGRVAFVGEISELEGYWVGVCFDEPVGKTDGTTPNGNRYFQASGGNYGGFLRGKNVNVGDFPERDIFDEDSEDDEL